MGVVEDLDYGSKILPYFEHFFEELYDEGLNLAGQDTTITWSEKHFMRLKALWDNA
jgi:hypothetical protein